MSNVEEAVPCPELDRSEMPTTGDAETDVEVLKSVPAGFAIDCEEHANWLVKKVVAARQYVERVKQWAEQEQRRAAREEQTLLFLFGRQIEAWVDSEIAKLKGKRKSINLPAGAVGFRLVRAQLVVDDEAAVLAWAKSNVPDAVVVVERLRKSVINEYAEKAGVIPDEGVHIEPATERFYIK
jgi:phage host-nuclease inhibitor protein Gam